MTIQYLNSLPSSGYPGTISYLKDEGKTYSWDSVNSRFYNISTPSFEDVVGINFSTLHNGDVLTYNSETGDWENKSLTITKSYGAWKNDETQFAHNNIDGFGIKFNTPDISDHGISIEPDLLGDKTLITFLNAGVYNIQFSLQFENIDVNYYEVSIWLRKNGEDASADIPGSARYITIPIKYNETNGHIVACFNYVVATLANDYFQLVWATTNSETISMKSYEAISPSASCYSSILTVNQID